ncbi:MAG: putative diguanylate cyclase [Microbacteriaceae bacterium]|nr:putative diguanylate cyclase [Microbacteriaceae bacterium]
MLGNASHVLGRTAMRLWLATSSQSWVDRPVPAGSLSAHAGGPDPDRVLLVGGNMAVGYGVHSHDLALAGHLARQLAAVTGRGTDVDVIAQPNMVIGACLSSLRGSDLSRFDAIVLTIGGTEALQLMGPRQWRRDLDALLDHATRNGSTNTQVFVLGIPPIESVGYVPSIARRLGSRRAKALDEQTVRACESRQRVTFVPYRLPPVDDIMADVDRRIFGAWAGLLVSAMAGPLNAGARAPHELPSIDESARQRSLESLGILDTPAEEQYDSITRMARDLFGVSGAAVTFLDRERQWVKSAIGVSAAETPRAAAFCNVTIARGELYVVEDASRDLHPWVAGDSGVRFYAGYPLTAPDGQRVGALCVVDTKPRTFDSVDAALLRELALRVQSVLWAGVRAGQHP